MPSMWPGGSSPGTSAPVSGVSHRLAIRQAGELFTLSRSSYWWSTRMGSPPAGAVTSAWSSVSTAGNPPPRWAAKVRGVAAARSAGESVVVMGTPSAAQLVAARTEAPARGPSTERGLRVLGQHARHPIPNGRYCDYLDVCLASQVKGHLG